MVKQVTSRVVDSMPLSETFVVFHWQGETTRDVCPGTARIPSPRVKLTETEDSFVYKKQSGSLRKRKTFWSGGILDFYA